jgi:DNA-binding NarL/FixJ family response regulator
MLDAARRLAPSGDESAAELLADAAIAAGMSGEVDARLVYRLARALDATTLRRPWAAVVRIMVGIDAVFGGDVSTGTASIDASLDDADGSGDAIELLWAGLGAITIGRDVDASVVLARAAAVARRTGALGVLTLALALRAPQAFVRGRLEEAAVDASEAVRLGREIGATNLVPHPLAIGAAVAALRGHEDEARARAEEAIALGGTQGVGLAAATATWTLGLLDLVRGRDAEALERLNSLREARPGFGHPVVTILTIPDRIEAAVRAGRPDEARAELPVYERWARDTGAAWAESRLAGCRALLADGDDATRHFEDAVEGADDARPFELGRIQLLFGEHLVRSRRRADARGRLRAALATFEQLNAVLWADRAASELHAIGEATRKREPSTIERLTPHELQIARLVAKGKSNKEVAAELFLSPRTIEYHLRKVYAALGISSRAELARLELGATVQEHVVVAAR